jgi:hypothetical protein
MSQQPLGYSPLKSNILSQYLAYYRLGRSRATLVCDGLTERIIKALMAFESFTSSYAHGLRVLFNSVSSNPTSQKLQPPPRGCMGPKRVESGRFTHIRMAERRHLSSENVRRVL